MSKTVALMTGLRIRAISARLHYGYSGSYISDDLTREYLIINGNRVKLFDANSIMDGQGVITAVNLSFIQQGINTIRWRMPRHETRIGNLRLEIDFPKNLAPTYTQPSTWFNLNRTNGFHPVMKKTGLQAVINSVGPYGTGPQGDGGPPFLFAPDDSPQGANLEYNQTYRITYSIRCGIQLISFGRCWGAQNVSLMLRNLSDPTRAITLQQYVFPPVPGTTSTHGVTNWGSSFEFRTADYQWGLSYELYVVAYDSNGTPALPDYFDGNHTTGEHFPAYLYIVEPDNDDTSNLTGLVRTIMKRDLQVGILEVENVSDRAPVPVDWHDMAAKLLGGEQESDHLNELFGAEDKEYASRELPSERAAPIKNETVVASSSGPRAPLPPKQIVPPPSDRPQSSTRSAFIVDVDESRSDPASLVGTVDPEAQHNPEFGLLTNTTDGYVANLLGSTPAGTMMVLPIPLDPSNTESPFDWGPGKDVEPSVGMENLGVGEIKG